MTQEGIGVIEGEGFEGLAGLEFAIAQVSGAVERLRRMRP